MCGLSLPVLYHRLTEQIFKTWTGLTRHYLINFLQAWEQVNACSWHINKTELNLTGPNWPEQVDPVTQRVHWSCASQYFVLIRCSETRTVGARLFFHRCKTVTCNRSDFSTRNPCTNIWSHFTSQNMPVWLLSTRCSCSSPLASPPHHHHIVVA